MNCSDSSQNELILAYTHCGIYPSRHLCRINLWGRGPAPRGGPALGRCFLIKERGWEKKEKGGKEGEKRKDCFRINKLAKRCPCWSMERF